ncbi:hypothetical protein [Azospirillum palustre]
MVDFDPSDRTAHNAEPAAPLTPQQVTQQIVDAVNAWLREGRETSILKRPDPTLAGYALVGKIGRIVAGALEALTAERDDALAVVSALRDELRNAGNACEALSIENSRLSREIEAIKSEGANA